MRPVEDEQEEDNFGGDDGEEFVLGKASLALASVAGSAVPGGRCSTAGGTRYLRGRCGRHWPRLSLVLRAAISFWAPGALRRAASSGGH